MGWDTLIQSADLAILNVLGKEQGATYIRAGGQEIALPRIIFDDRYVPVDPDNIEITTTGPAAFIHSVDLPAGFIADPQADRLKVAGKTYRVMVTRSAGEGGLWLVLHEVKP